MIILIGVCVVVVLWCIGIYNNLVSLRNNRENAFANIDVQLKQRYDLIPQLVETVKGYAAHEKELLERITQARTAAMGATTINDKIEAENQLSSALAGLKVSVEAYPDLKAADLYKEVTEGVRQYEEHVRMSRMVYNDTATKMNRMVRQWPSSIVASMLNFGQRDYLKTDEPQKKSYPNLSEAFKK